jgi:polyhydroxyalkanoate synthesis regulator phasin
MPQTPDWNKYLDAGVEFVAMTRAQARKRAKELVGTGQLAQEQVQQFVDDLVDESRRRTDVLMDVVRKEIQRQVKTLGIATKDDLARLETKMSKQAGSSAKKAAKKAAKQSAGAKSKPAKKSKAKASANGSGKKSAKSAKKSTKKTAKASGSKRAATKSS